MRTLGYLRDGFSEAYTQTMSTEQQKAAIRKRHAHYKEKNRKIGPRALTAKTDTSSFKVVPGEDINARLSRLEAAGVYTPGSIMSSSYANMVNYGTTDRNAIAQINRQRQEWQDQQNLKRYGTTDIKKITAIVASKRGGREAMWQRVYGTSNPDAVYSMDAARRKALCQADAECRSMETSLFNGYNGFANFGAFNNLIRAGRLK